MSFGQSDGSPLTVWPHYKVYADIASMDDIRPFFPGGQANDLNWLFLSTSGVHGTYRTLDEIEYDLKDREHRRESEQETDVNQEVTVLIVQPRLVVMHYGHVPITLDDIPYLRGLVRSTLEAVARSQEGNT